jgi:trehalose-phosphatase
MQTLKPRFDVDGFFARVAKAPARVLMLDYDGTLAPFHVDPALAAPYPGVVPLLDAIVEAGRTHLVIVSGRWIKDLVPLLGLKRQPELWGSHGWERLGTDGDYRSARLRPLARMLLSSTDDRLVGLTALGARIERKHASIACHWRGLSNGQIVEIRAKLFEIWMELAHANELAWHDFDGGIELRAAGRDKGDVVRALAAEAGPDAALAYLGDDLTDEDAFRAMPDHGAAVLVQLRPRRTDASVWVRPPEELLEFLQRWHEASRGYPRELDHD